MQTAGIDILQSYRMVEETIYLLKLFCRDFDTILKEVNTFIHVVNSQFSENDILLQVEEEFPVKKKPNFMMKK